ncbi:MAG: DMT family transporter [Pseudomonadota bacterium]|nr:DMT family transporter [Pseudomonadota bacterium]
MPYFLLGFLSLLWGSSFLLIAIAARGFDPLSFAFVRVSIGALSLWALSLALERCWPRGRGLWLRLAAMAAFGQALPFVLLGEAARRIGSGELALMMGAAPILAFVLSRWLGEGPRWTAASALGLALGLAGVAVCVGTPQAGASFLGRAEGLLAAFGYALGATLSRQASRAVGPSTAAAASMSLSAIALGIVWRGNGGAAATLLVIPARSLEAMLALGLFNTALAYFVYFTLVVRRGAAFATLNNYVVPFVGLLLGAIFLGERIALGAWIGLALVIAGIALTGRTARA